MKRHLLICPRDPMLFRDGKPFAAGSGAASLTWPSPSTIIGSIRTRMWSGAEFGEDAQRRLLNVCHTGPFRAFREKTGSRKQEETWQLAFPSPADALVYGSESSFEIVPLRPAPVSEGAEGSDLPEGLQPLAGARSIKPSRGAPAFWTAEQTLQWLRKTSVEPWFRTDTNLGLPRLPEQNRVHVRMEADRRNAADGMLFRTQSLEFDFDGGFHGGQAGGKSGQSAIYSEVESKTGDDGYFRTPEGFAPLGGERRMAGWLNKESSLLPTAPTQQPDYATRVRLQLVTPGFFKGGWKPDWAVSGRPPGTRGLKLKLVAAAIPRYTMASGFDMALQGMARFRATRFLAPAGSTYFFEVEEGNPLDLWLKPIGDDDQLNLDGFGIVLVGRW